jgi:KUP system potassium uptake protein
MKPLGPIDKEAAPVGRAPPHTPPGGFAALTMGAVGIVYGDIGTSPLYAIDQIFFAHGGVARTSGNVLGGISLVIWTLTIIVSIKYAILVLRAQNDGEGGVFALYGLLHQHRSRTFSVLLWSLMIGAGLLLGDGMITPAISVLSAVEGVGVAAPSLGRAIVPVTAVLLALLFAIQSRGTSRIGRVFGPVLIVWFVAIALLGIGQIRLHPEICAAFNPWYAIVFLRHSGLYPALLILGALMLVVTGGEAMYADLGHFGQRAIRTSWFGMVLSGVAAQLSRSRRLFAECGARRRGQALLQSRSACAPVPHDRACDGRDHHRVAGTDLGRILPYAAGHRPRPMDWQSPGSWWSRRLR